MLLLTCTEHNSRPQIPKTVDNQGFPEVLTPKTQVLPAPVELVTWDKNPQEMFSQSPGDSDIFVTTLLPPERSIVLFQRPATFQGTCEI